MADEKKRILEEVNPEAEDKDYSTIRVSTKKEYVPYNYYADKDKLAPTENLAAAEKAQPGPYQGKYDDQIQSILDDIVNRGEFKYDFNADPLYHQYAENYTNKGKLAAMDTLGMASAMTGGYGSTYGQQAAQQTYNGYMQDLSNQIPSLYQLAENTYWNNVAGKRADLGDLEGLDNTDYGRYRDTYSDWKDTRNYEYQKYRDSIADLQNMMAYYAANPKVDPKHTEIAHKVMTFIPGSKLLNETNGGTKIEIPVRSENGKTVGIKLSPDEAANLLSSGKIAYDESSPYNNTRYIIKDESIYED